MVVRLRHRRPDRGQHSSSSDRFRQQPHPAHCRRYRKDLSNSLRDGVPGAMEAAAIGHGNKGTQQLEIQHAIDPYLRSIIL
jgi:hypothetical protein